ncbi:MAG: hypothetical protein DHS20C01_00100 [marine bacterium B5-7]|nr:MAG: hypothetical protein DHS20C01_00100 [marine bacterium B5-7]
MNEDHLNMQIRKFLKKVGIQSQRDIENAVARAIAEGRISVGDELKASMRLNVSGIDLDVTIDGDISIEQDD